MRHGSPPQSLGHTTLLTAFERREGYACDGTVPGPTPTWISSGPRQAVRWSFYAFVFSLPFETLLKTVSGGAENHFSLSKMTGYLFLLCALLQPRLCFRRPPPAFWCFAAYLFFVAFRGAQQDVFYDEMVFSRMITLIQMLFLFWITFNLLTQGGIVSGALLSFSLSVTALGALQMAGVSTTDLAYGKGMRTTALGEDPNWSATVMALGIVTVLGLAYGRAKVSPLTRLLMWPLLIVVGIPMIRTGSRGGSLALAAGLLAFLLRRGSLRIKLRNAFLALLIICLFVSISYQSKTVRMRWEQTLGVGSKSRMSHREQVYPAAWQLFTEQPLFGWGPVRHLYALGRRINERYRDTHNLILWVLTEVGLIGAFPFFIGLWLCLRSAWKARAGMEGILPLAMTLTLLTANMSLTLHNRKLHWFVLAYALASSSCMRAAARDKTDGQRCLLRDL